MFNEHPQPPNPSYNPHSAPPSATTCHVCGLPIENEHHPCLQSSSSALNPLDDPRIGQMFGRSYRIEARAGEGGMSVVYKARHELLDSVVAIKVLKPMLAMDESKLARFQQEAISVSRLNHPNIIVVHHFELPQQGEPFLVMDFVDGPPLSEVLAAQPQIAFERCIAIFSLVCDALQHAHDAGVIHRDVKPSNILLGREAGGKETPKIVDFGIAKLIDAETSAQTVANLNEVFGSPLYMSPEQCAAKQMDVRSDIYSTGCVIFEALAGRPPFVGQNPQETMKMHVFERVPKVSEFRPGLPHADQVDAIMFKAMAKHPSDRFQTMQELKEALDAIGPHQQTTDLRARPSDMSAPTLPPTAQAYKQPEEVPALFDEALEQYEKPSQFDTSKLRKPTNAKRSSYQKSAKPQSGRTKEPRPANLPALPKIDLSGARKLGGSNVVRRVLLLAICLAAALGAVSLAFMFSGNKTQIVTFDDWHASIMTGQKLFDSGKLPEAKEMLEQALLQSNQIKDGFGHGRAVGSLQELTDISVASKQSPDKYVKQLEPLETEDAKTTQALLQRLNSAPGKDEGGTHQSAKELEQLQSVDAGSAQLPSEAPKPTQEKPSMATHLLISRAVEAAMLEFRNGQLVLAKQLLEKSLILCSEHLDPGSPSEIRCYLYLGMIAIEEGHLDDAQKNLEKGLALAKQFRDRRMAAQLSLMLARLSVDQFQPEESLVRCKEAEGLVKHMDGVYSHGMITAHIIEGNAYQLLKKFDDARAKYADALKILDSLSDHDLPVESDCKMQNARLLSKSLNDHEAAVSTLEVAINSLEGKEPRTTREWRYLAQALSELAVLKTESPRASTPLKNRSAAIWRRTEPDVKIDAVDLKALPAEVKPAPEDAQTEQPVETKSERMPDTKPEMEDPRLAPKHPKDETPDFKPSPTEPKNEPPGAKNGPSDSKSPAIDTYTGF